MPIKNFSTADFEALIEASHNEVYLFDAETFKFVLVNTAALKNLGYSLDELKDLSPWDLKPDYSKTKYKNLVESFANGEMEKVEFRTSHERKDGGRYPVRVHLQLGSLDERRVFVSLALDESEKQELERQLIQSAKLATIGELAAGVGHEINNPLAIASGNLTRVERLLSKKGVHDEKINNTLAKIEAAHSRIRDIVDGLRTFARADSDQTRPICVQESIQQTLNMLGEIAHFDQIDIQTHLPKDKVYVQASVGKLQQIVMNLFSNAKDAMRDVQDRTVVIRLEVNASSDVKLKISDNGCGMSQELQKKIFDPFFTTKEVGAGTGLGLGIVKELVSKLGGNIAVQSRQGRGTSFEITLPQCHAPELEISNSGPIASNDPSGGIVASVLVVDDEPDVREVIVEFLQEAGCCVQEAENGAKALELMSFCEFDVVFTDMKMPEMDGPTFVKTARENGLQDLPKFVAITGGVENDFSKEGRGELRDLFDAYLLKPFRSKELIAILSDVLDFESEEAA